MQQIYDKDGTKTGNVKSVPVSFFSQSFLWFYEKTTFERYFYRIWGNYAEQTKKKNELNKNDKKWESSLATLETRFDEVYHSELKDEIVLCI